MWVPRFRSALCDESCDSRDAIYRCLSTERREALAPFLAQYRHVRARDGYRAQDPEYYRSLPHVFDAAPQADVWKIRQRSFERVCALISPGGAAGGAAVLDLGAGNGWLSHQLAALGCRSVAVDVLVDETDGLGAARHYDAPFVCVEADFDELPFTPDQFDAVVFNGSLHYSPDADATLTRAAALLRPRGLMVVADSPMFTRRIDGLAMRRRLQEKLERDYEIAVAIQPGEGFLTFECLASWADRRGKQTQFFASDAGWRARLRRAALGRSLADVVPPQFGVWVAS